MRLKYFIYQWLFISGTTLILIALYHYKIASKLVLHQTERSASFLEVNEKDTRRMSAINSLSPDHFIQAAEKSKSSVLYIIAYEKVSGSVFSEGYTREKGSGVIISDDGYIVTNNHVINNADFIEITLEDKRKFVADIIGKDESTDLALLKIEASALPFMKFSNSDSLRVGQWILAIGNPFGLQSTVTAGIVSAKARNIDALSKNDIESFIQSDAVINPGSSGGAFVDDQGNLMGICTAILSSTGNYQGMSFAIPSNLVKKVVTDLKQFGSVQRGKLGITISEVDADIAFSQKLPSISGVLINSINLNSAAAEAGLMTNDVVWKIDDYQISGTSEFYEIINQYRPGDEIELHYYRKGRKKQVSIVLRNYLNTTDFVTVRSDKELKEIGIEIRDLNSIEKDRLNSNGIMIISISKGSKVANTNMEPGFVVEYFNDQKLTGTKQFLDLLKRSPKDITLIGFYERYPGRFPYTFSVSDKQ